jgi:hypothetical protein
MSNPQIPSDQDGQSPVPSRFDAMCSEVEDFEPLPTVTPTPARAVKDLEEEERTAPLDELILAGLVSP